MTHSIDNFLISHGFEAKDVTSVTHRTVFYYAIMITSFFALTFTSLAINAWA